MTLEDALGYYFLEKGLLTQALTRKAYALEKKQKGQACEDQETFRTLGDAVIKLVLIDLLIQHGITSRHNITQEKIELERAETLAEIARCLGVPNYLYLSEGEKKQNAHKETRVLSETLEAIIGAIYMDQGYDAAYAVVAEIFEERIKKKD